MTETLAQLNPGLADMIATALAHEMRERAWESPGAMAVALDRTTVQTLRCSSSTGTSSTSPKVAPSGSSSRCPRRRESPSAPRAGSPCGCCTATRTSASRSSPTATTSPDDGAAGVVCVRVEGGLTGRPVDLLIIDDPYKDAKQADSNAWRETVRNFWTEVALRRLAPGAPVALIQTRWREDDMAGWLAETGDAGPC